MCVDSLLLDQWNWLLYKVRLLWTGPGSLDVSLFTREVDGPFSTEVKKVLGGGGSKERLGGEGSKERNGPNEDSGVFRTFTMSSLFNCSGNL